MGSRQPRRDGMFSLFRKLWGGTDKVPQQEPAKPVAANDFSDLDLKRLTTLKQLGFNTKCIFAIGASNGSWSPLPATLLPHAGHHLFQPLNAPAHSYPHRPTPIL